MKSSKNLLLQRAAVLVATLSMAWTVWIVVFGGFDTRILGVRIKSNEPLRALFATSVALGIYAAARGFTSTLDDWTRRIAAIDTRRVAIVLAVLTCALGVWYATTAAIGPDPYGYVSQADLWIGGRLSIPQPWAHAVPWPSPEWTFTPLGYRPSLEGTANGAGSIVPIYSPGLPLLMAAFKIIAGHAAMFWVVPIAGGLLVLATYGIGRQLDSPVAGLIAAWLVATSPAFLFMLMQPMSDVPAAACWAMAIYFVLCSTVGASVAAGLAAAVAIVIRPNLWPLTAALAVWPLLRLWFDKNSRPAAVMQLLALCAAAALGPLAVAAIYARLYGSPLTSGYGDLAAYFSWTHVVPNLKHYFTWLVGSQTPIVLAGMAALAVPLKTLWPRVPDRRVFLVFAAFMLVLWGEYLVYDESDAWWFLRFLLPSWPLIMLGVGAVAVAVARSMPSAYAIVIAWLVFMLGANGMQLSTERGAFNEWRNDRRYLDVAARVRQVTDDSSIVYTMYQSGSIRYYGGRQTFRFDLLDRDWLDQSVAWFASHHVHPYALFANRTELEDFKRHFAGQRGADRLDESLVFTYSDQDIVYFYFYDLLQTETRPAHVETSADLSALRSAPPIPTPLLTLTP